MKLSIIIPVYNTEKFLDKCLDSIYNQTFTDFECLVIDDGSTDKSRSIIKYYTLKDKRFKAVYKYNSGVSDTRNIGIFLSKGEYIGFIDSDDYIEPIMYEKLIDIAEKKNKSIVRCGLNHIWSGGTSVWTMPTGDYNIRDQIINSSPEYDFPNTVQNIYKASLLKDNNITFKNCSYAEDLLFNIEAFTKAESLYNIEEPLYNYVRHSGSLSKSVLSSDHYIKMITYFNDTCNKLSSSSLFNEYYKDIIEKNFYLRRSISQLRKNCIDYVVPFVDNTDPVWIEQYNQYSPDKIDNEINGDHRFRADTELFKYQFRGIEKYMPFIDTIHLLVSSKSQVPDWIDQTKVHIVEHKEFIPEQFLPTFNSSTIEMFLHKIPGLSEKFIYGNDDFYYTYNLQERFYFGNNKIKSILEAHPFADKKNPPLWKKIFVNSYNLAKYGNINIETDENVYYVPPHVEQGMLKSKIEEIYNLYEKEILDSCTRFRDPKNLNQYLFTDYLILKENYIEGVHSYRNFNSSSKKEDLINAITNPNNNKVIRSFVLNDTGSLENTKTLKEYISQLLPNKSKYEK